MITKNTNPWGWVDAANAINAAQGSMKTNPTLITGAVTLGTMSVNYRNELLPFRVSNPADPNGTKHDPSNPQTDMSYVFS